MAVAGLSGVWILAVLTANHPEGVLRRALLDEFAVLLVSKRSSKGAKGRVARRLYARLNMLQRRGLVVLEDGLVRPLAAAAKVRTALPEPGPVLRKLLFLALLVEDRSDRPEVPELRRARWAFLARAVEEGWSLAQGAATLGISTARAEDLVRNPPRPA